MPSLRLSPLTVLVVLTLAVPVDPASAQGRRPTTPETRAARDSVIDIPESMMPPAGKCRIWMNDVPAKQQPAPTDCTTAFRQKPSNAVLVFGPTVRDLSPFAVRNRRARDTQRVPAVDSGVPLPASRQVPASREAASREPERREPESREAPPPAKRDTPPPAPKKPEKP